MAAQDTLVLLLPPHLLLRLRIHMMKRRGAPISGGPSAIPKSAYIHLLFVALIDVCSLEPGVLLCVSCHWTGFMGSSSWEFRVRIFLHTLSDILPHGVKTRPRLPPSEHGEWWEIGDESRGGIPYYYHTKTGETVWEKPGGF